jgi:Holliday junction resolvase RusA-like endonuclease
MIRFTVSGQPVCKQSFRIGKRNYRDPNVTRWEQLVAQHAMLAMVGREPFQDGVKVTLRFRLADRRRRDLDNLSKGTLDAGNGILWEDDMQIQELHIYRERGEPGVTVEVEPC